MAETNLVPYDIDDEGEQGGKLEKLTLHCNR
jgi:hypothetical protein